VEDFQERSKILEGCTLLYCNQTVAILNTGKKNPNSYSDAKVFQLAIEAQLTRYYTIQYNTMF